MQRIKNTPFGQCPLSERHVSLALPCRSPAVGSKGTGINIFSFPFNLTVAACEFALHVGHCAFASMHVFIEEL